MINGDIFALNQLSSNFKGKEDKGMKLRKTASARTVEAYAVCACVYTLSCSCSGLCGCLCTGSHRENSANDYNEDHNGEISTASNVNSGSTVNMTM